VTRVGVGKRGYWGLLTRLLHSPVVVCSALPQLVVYCRAHVKQCQLASAELSAVGPPSWFCVAVGVPSSLRNGGGRVGLEGIGLRRLGYGSRPAELTLTPPNLQPRILASSQATTVAVA
jgi:hypothetical protein